MLNRRFEFGQFAGVLIILSCQAAAQQGDLRLVPSQETPLAVTLKKQGASSAEIWQGTGKITVQNDGTEPRKIQLGYMVTKTGKVLPITTNSTAPLQELRVTVAPTLTTELSPDEKATPLTLTFQAPPNSKLTALTGLLLIRSAGTEDFGNALPVNFILPETPNVNAFSPAKVTLNLTQVLPGLKPDWTFEWPKPHRISWSSSAAATPQSEWLASNQGGRLKVRALDKVDADGNFTLKTSSIGGAGSYTGDLALTPDDPDAPKLAVTANVQHLFVWPLLTILMGCLGAYVLIRYREMQRPKELLRGQIKTIQANYAKAEATLRAAGFGSVDFAYNYDDAFSDAQAQPPLKWWRWPLKGWRQPSPDPNSPPPFAYQLYKRINDSRRKEELTTLAKEIDEFGTCIAAWSARQQTIKTLRANLASLEKFMAKRSFSTDEGAFPAVTDVQTILVHVDAPTTAGALSAQEAKIQQAGDFLKHLRDGQTIYNRAEITYDALVKQGHVPIGVRLPDIFQEAFRNAQNLEKLKLGAALIGMVETQLANTANNKQIVESSEDYQVLLVQNVAEAPVALAQAGETRSADKIMQQIRIMDRVDYWAAFILAVVTYFVTIYTKGTFGSWHEYLTAFLFGLGGTLIVKGASLTPTLPWQQSMRYAADKSS